MRAILYSADDADNVRSILKLLVHIGDCPGCQQLVAVPGEQRDHLAFLMSWLDSITSDTIQTPGEAIAFCEYWLTKHEQLSYEEALQNPAGHA